MTTSSRHSAGTRSPVRSCSLAAAVAFVALLSTPTARAEMSADAGVDQAVPPTPPPESPPPPPPTTSVTYSELEGEQPQIAPAERLYLYTQDPSIPLPGHVIVSAGMGNVTRTGEQRPVGASDIIPTATLEVGVVKRLSIFTETGVIFWNTGTRYVSPMTVETGPRVLLTNPTSNDLLLTVAPVYGLDFFGNSSLEFDTSFAWQYRIMRLAAEAIVSHTFQSGADPADVQASLGISVLLPLGFLVGAEGVVTDLEEIATPGAEGGSSAYAGPTFGWEWKHRFQIIGGPAYGAGPNYVGWLGRVSASAQF